ncbi:ThuA domain-containing protein [Rubripirellula sp.]|jgi:hypothetical protein|nr:ThuA domain-containing protein [Rubripirellula sp.]
MNRSIQRLLAFGLLLTGGFSGASAEEISAGKKSLPLAGESFRLDGHDAFAITPEVITPNTPWVWYAPTLKGLPSKAEVWMFERFAKAGIAVAGIDVGESYGSPDGRNLYSALYNYLVKERQFSARPVLLARSRGGLMLYSWAVENPQAVGGIAGIYPVCNLESYPGLNRASGAYGLTPEQLKQQLANHNPIDRLEALAQAKVPVFHTHGDQDTVVPLAANSGTVAERYKALGGSMELDVVKGQGHNMWSGWFTNEKLTEFVIAHAKAVPSELTEAQDSETASEAWLTYTGDKGPGKGKHVVLVAAEQEYRSEQSMPMLAKVLSKHHGFDCTVLFSVNDQGEVDPTLPAPFKDKTKRHHIPGLHLLADADCVIWLSRFMQLPDDQMQNFHEYFDSGKPLIALRTANHGFWGGKPYMHDGNRVSLRELLGGTFMGHHGGWHRESTRGIIVKENQTHPILTGVEDIWGTSDVYRCHNEKAPFPTDCKALVLGQPLINLEPDAAPNESKEPLPVAWTKTWTGKQGRPTRIFHFTMGSAEDFENAGVKRLTVNAVYWGLGMEAEISPDSSVETVGEYQPLKAGFNYEKLGVQPHPPEFYK